ncbi:hypothetical protein [Symmachiella macrocystis]|uniref:hypothetical protein n=1 Tax=Symmachiella macrocystis TaxID=2527985 RepID=UPI0011B5AB54|nr:hypothetical protein [Symmachiella macrocystis]
MGGSIARSDGPCTDGNAVSAHSMFAGTGKPVSTIQSGDWGDLRPSVPCRGQLSHKRIASCDFVVVDFANGLAARPQHPVPQRQTLPRFAQQQEEATPSSEFPSAAVANSIRSIPSQLAKTTDSVTTTTKHRAKL